jgi:hypothetical protein
VASRSSVAEVSRSADCITATAEPTAIDVEIGTGATDVAGLDAARAVIGVIPVDVRELFAGDGSDRLCSVCVALRSVAPNGIR